MTKIPEHLADFPWEVYHLYKPKTSKKFSTNKNFATDAIRIYDLTYNIELTHIIPLTPTGKVLVAAKATVTRNGKEHTAYASVSTKMHEGGQEHFAQLAGTRALNAAVDRAMFITEHDIDMIVEHLGGPQAILKGITYDDSDNNPEPDAPEETAPAETDEEIRIKQTAMREKMKGLMK